MLVGGVAVDLHTGVYTPTDIDLVGAVSKDDKQRLVDAGFEADGSRHIRWTFSDGTSELVEFPDDVLDGTLVGVTLNDDVVVNVISLESLVIDHLEQATDQTVVTYEEAVRLVAATTESVDWPVVSNRIRERPLRAPIESLARRVLEEAGEMDISERWFPIDE